MQLMLSHMKSRGLGNISFIIVNTRKGSAPEMIDQLIDRVIDISVYQETDVEQVWPVLRGGKDDMFVYDRCGRLTYYVPFPTSIISSGTPPVYAALLSTYNGTICGRDDDCLDEKLQNVTDSEVKIYKREITAMNETEIEENITANDSSATDVLNGSNKTETHAESTSGETITQNNIEY